MCLQIIWGDARLAQAVHSRSRESVLPFGALGENLYIFVSH